MPTLWIVMANEALLISTIDIKYIEVSNLTDISTTRPRQSVAIDTAVATPIRETVIIT